ncbi:MAG: DUF2029 domain-containing protein [Alphaproteobacteria bacterium]|nr:DUF2029 domain-containing protein [Alphaproteobacteria bacterium]
MRISEATRATATTAACVATAAVLVQAASIPRYPGAPGPVAGLDGGVRLAFGLPPDLLMLTLWAALAVLTAWTTRSLTRLPLAVVLGAVALRVVVLDLPPLLSDDLYRYLWEGRVQAAGFDPFRYAPDAIELSEVRDALWGKVNHRHVSTIYPPGALWLFRGVSALWHDPMAWKTLSAAADLGVLALLAAIGRGRGRSAAWPTLYALLPLPVLESAGSGHLEAVALVGLAGAVLAHDRGRPTLAALAATAGGLVKLLPAALLAPLGLRHGRRLALGLALSAGLTLALAAPFLEAGATLGRGFNTYYEAWAFNPALFPALEALTGDPETARALGVAAGAAWCAGALVRLKDPAAVMLHVAGALLLLSPVVHPWYVLWALVPALIVRSWPWVVLAITAPLSYAVLRYYDPATGEGWREPWWLNEVVYGPLLVSLAWSTIQRLRSRGSPSDPAPGSPSPSPT